MVIGYARISSTRQLLGHGLEVQEQEIKQRYPDAIVYKEQFTGCKMDRPIFTKLIGELQSGDTLVCARLDRMARDTVEGIKIVKDLFARNVAVHVLNIGLLENSNMGRFFLTTLLSIAEMEKNTIWERTSAGREIARQTNPNYRDGRPKKYKKDTVDYWLDEIEKGKTYTLVENLSGISRSTLIRAMREKRAKIEEPECI